MTIYTDQVTGKQYDRVPGGVTDGKDHIEGYVPCRECAFSDARKQSAECIRAAAYCVSSTAGKPVFFVFKERKE